jgi:hypothetical protein
MHHLPIDRIEFEKKKAEPFPTLPLGSDALSSFRECYLSADIDSLPGSPNIHFRDASLGEH